MAAFHFELVSPEKLLFSGDVEAVVVPGTEGDFQMLKGHAPTMSMLRPGVVVVDETDAKTSKLFVRGGFAEISDKGLTILAEQAIPLAELDGAKLDQEIRNLEEDVADAKSDDARRAASEKLAHLRDLKTALKL
jgi:F-type H+-transporting ATPase subunit epsilon